MINRNKISVRVAIVVIMSFYLTSSSCKKILKIDPPKSSVEQNLVFSNDGQAIAAMTSVYTQMYSTFNYASGGASSITVYAGASSDELIGYNLLLPFYENQITPDLSNFGLLYSGLYRSIYTTNAILEGVSLPNEITLPTKNQLIGEASFVRAFAYFYLTNLFGEIPLQLTTDYRTTSLSKKSPIPLVYKQILKDLKESEIYLTDIYPSAGRVRPNRAVVQAMLARVYLYMKDWENAAKYASLLIERTKIYSLIEFDKVFLANSPEAIWQLMPPTNANTQEGALFIPSSTSAVPNTVSLSSKYIDESFALNDKRRTSWIKNYTWNSTMYYYPFKYKIRSSSTVSEYSMVLRLAEQYLIRAEARINQGDIINGISDLNIVRQRQLPVIGISNPVTAILTTIGKSEALLAIERERQAELFSEWGHRWFDLKRTERIDAVLGLIKPNWQSIDKLYPIPSDELTRNKNITQNEGY